MHLCFTPTESWDDLVGVVPSRPASRVPEDGAPWGLRRHRGLLRRRSLVEQQHIPTGLFGVGPAHRSSDAGGLSGPLHGADSAR